MHIACENELCLYQKSGFCRLSQIGVDSMGFCNACILVPIPSAWLDRYKQHGLKKIEIEEKRDP